MPGRMVPISSGRIVVPLTIRIEAKPQDFGDLTRQRHQTSAAIVQDRVSLLSN